MMKISTILLIIGLITLNSCKDKENEYFRNESKIVFDKIMYNQSMIHTKYLLNQQMAEPYFLTAKHLKINFDSIQLFIDNDDKIKTQDKLRELYDLILSNAIFDSKYIKDIILPNRFNKWFDAIDKNDLFDNPDLLKLETFNLEYELTSFLFNDIENDYYKFNILEPVILDSSKNLKVGDTYHAKIMFAAFDSTRYPLIMVADISQPDSILLLDRPDNKKLFNLDVVDGKGIYNKRLNSAGRHGFKGVICFPNAAGYMERFMFKKEFDVKNK